MQALELILILLVVTGALQLVAERYSIPLPALLIMCGLILAVTPGLPRPELDPDIIFLIFIPPLLYWAALTTSLRDLSRNLRSISLLAVGLVLATMIVVAWVAHALVPEMTWASAFVLGAIVSPPDAVAVSAVTRRLGLPNTINTILNGESLLNDATAFVAYRMAVAAVVAGTFSIWQAGFRFVWTGVGAIALGLVIGWLIGRLRRLIGQTPLVENTISLLTPFVAFIPAERLGLASVLTVVATGLYLGRQGPKVVSAVTRLQTIAMWEMLVFILEGLIFIIVGLELRNVLQALADHSLSRLIYYTVALSAVMIVLRIGWVFVGAYLPRFIGRHRRGRRNAERYPPWREVLFVGWAGMRGGDSLVIALALPLVTHSGGLFPARDLIIFLTFGVILISLVVQGFSLAPIIRWLKLTLKQANRPQVWFVR
jgi:Na+/H+ antiporter